MTRDQLWEIYCEKNPGFAKASTATVTLTIGGLRKLHEESWRHAYAKGLEAGRDLERKQRMADAGSEDIPDFVKKLLSRK